MDASSFSFFVVSVPLSGLRARLRRASVVAAIAASALLLAGCAGTGPEITGGQGGKEDGVTVDDDTGGETDERGGIDDDTGSARAPVGEIEVKIERRNGVIDYLYFDASVCEVGHDRVVGEGSSAGEGDGSIRIDTGPFELLHERTGTWQAQGSIRVEADDDRLTSDGRRGAGGIESMFTYRLGDNAITYTTSWFDDSGLHASDGFVKMNCF